MSIQDRLKEQRYGELYFQVPNRYELNNQILSRSTMYKLRKENFYLSVYNIYMKNGQGRYKEGYNQLINDYADIYTYKSKSWTFIVNLMYRRYLYFLDNKQYYNNSFLSYATIWYTSSLFQMRKAILANMIRNKEIPAIRDLNSPNTNGWYSLVKPMENKYTINRALQVFDLIGSIE
jgi:hypothetical protein